MISKQEFVKMYYPGLEEGTVEYAYFENEYDTVLKDLSRLDKNKVYSKENMAILLGAREFKSQSTFFRVRRIYMRMMLSAGFNYKTINALNGVTFEDVYSVSGFEREYFGSIEDLYESITMVAGSDVNKSRISAMALALLMWDGVNLVQSTNLKLCDLVLETGFALVDGKRVRLSPLTIGAIEKQIANRRLGGEFLFPGRYGGKAHITTTNKMIVKMNEAGCNKVFFTNSIITSGDFYRHWVSGEDISTLHRDLWLKYRLWVKTFHPDNN